MPDKNQSNSWNIPAAQVRTLLEVRGPQSGHRLFDLCPETGELYLRRGGIVDVIDLRQLIPELRAALDKKLLDKAP